MTETLFAFDERNYLDCQNAFRGTGNQEYYLGDYSIEGGSVIDVRADKKAVGVCSIIRLRSRTRLLFRRSWAHIREDPTDVTVLWFVKRGQLCVSHQSGYTAAKTGDFVITKSMTPFFIECQPDEDMVHEVLHVVIPTHVMRSYISQDVLTGFSTTAAGSQYGIVQNILTGLFEDEGDLPVQIAQNLVDSALVLLSHALGTSGAGGPARQSVSDKRLQDVLRYVEVHLSDPKLSIAMVAKGCGISPRYLSFLLKHHGTPFSALVWDQRLKMASRWLLSSKPGDTSISEIAYRIGFKSSAHFSRMFKRAFNMSPREYRATSEAEAPHQRPELPAVEAASLQ
jgi:AraC-like DNA-binding protein